MKYEQSGFRDIEYSLRHRYYYGENCPAVDLDFPLLEYDRKVPMAIIENKRFNKQYDVTDANNASLAELSNGYRDGMPFIINRYWPDYSVTLIPVNDHARKILKFGTRFSEYDYCRFLHEIRNRKPTEAVLSQLNTTLMCGPG